MTFGHLLALKFIQICISQSFVSFFLIYLKTLNEFILLNLQVKSASEFGCLSVPITQKKCYVQCRFY